MQSGAGFRLTMRRGPHPNQVYELTRDTITIGRDITNDIVINDPEQLYRDFQYWYIAPKNMKTMNELAMKYKKLSMDKGSKMPYRVYRSGFGTNENFIMFVASGKDPAEFEARRMANNELMGEEAKNIYFEGLNHALRVEHLTGWMRPDMSFMAEKEAEAKKN